VRAVAAGTLAAGTLAAGASALAPGPASALVPPPLPPAAEGGLLQPTQAPQRWVPPLPRPKPAPPAPAASGGGGAAPAPERTAGPRASAARPSGAGPIDPAAVEPPPPPPPQAAAALPAGDEFRILFAAGADAVPDAAAALLDGIAARLAAAPDRRAQLRAYADAGDAPAREARRLSLDRALAVRAALAARGVRTTRVDVRGLGATAADGPPDRVDVVIVD